MITRQALAAGLMPLLALAACAEARVPNLTAPLGDNSSFGTDLRAEDPVLGITLIDPFDRLPG